MNKLRKFLFKQIKKLAPKDEITAIVPPGLLLFDDRWDRRYIQTNDGLRLYFEDGQYVGFSTQEPYIGKTEEPGVG